MWTDERVALAKQMWLDGKSGGEIARTLGGASRNAVIAKLDRLGLLRSDRAHRQGAGLNKQRATKPSSRKVAKAARIAATRKPVEPPQPIAPLNVPFIDRKPGQCKAITDATQFEQRCCGHPAAPGEPYCAAHKQLYTVQTTASKTSVARLASLARWLDARGPYKIASFGP